MVVMKESGHSPLYWKMARVLEIYPGPEGTVRKVRLRTFARDDVRRVVHQLVPLLPEEGQEQSVEKQSIIKSRIPDTTRGSSPLETRGRVAHATVLLCISLLAAKVSAGSVKPIHEPKVTETGYVSKGLLSSAHHLQFGKVYKNLFTPINGRYPKLL